MLKSIVVFAVLASFGSVATAADVIPKRFKPNQFPQVVEMVEGKMRKGGPNEATPEEAGRVRGLLKEMEGLLEGKQRLADLNHLEKAEVEKRRVAINELLGDNDGSDSRTASTTRKRTVTDMLDSRPLPGGG